MNEIVLTAGVGVVASAIGVLSGAFVREASRKAARDQIMETLRGEFAEFENRFLQKLNGRYQASSACALIEKGIAGRIDNAESKLAEISDYAHETRHDLTSRLLGMEAIMRAQERGG